MCNDYGNLIPYSEYTETFGAMGVTVMAPGGAPNLEPRADIWPTETAPVLRRSSEGVELVQLRWGFDPGRAKAPPVINFRSENRHFATGRCLVPASHFFEFTGTRSPKGEMALHQSRGGVVLLRGALASGAGRRARGVHAPDHRARA